MKKILALLLSLGLVLSASTALAEDAIKMAVNDYRAKRGEAVSAE